MSNPKPYQRQQHTCPNCEIGVIAVLQDGEQRYGKCLCAKGEANYKGLPPATVVEYPFRSDGKLMAAGEEVEGLDF
jgi:hypothetical protein